MARNDYCKGCIYQGYAGGEQRCCDYIFIEGKRRPCPPGKDCTVKTTERKRKAPKPNVRGTRRNCAYCGTEFVLHNNGKQIYCCSKCRYDARNKAVRERKNDMKVVLDHGAIMPTRAHKLDAGYDLYTPHDAYVAACTINGNAYEGCVRGSANIGHAIIDTGVHVQIPKGYVGFIKSKSGLNVTHGLSGEGVIDAGYTGSIRVKLYNHSDKAYSFKAGEKIAQLVLLPILTPELELVDSLEDTERGTGGFGSTGK